jgi:lysophospholipid acyltransferase (LPLAT)-like uncharacterized protein
MNSPTRQFAESRLAPAPSVLSGAQLRRAALIAAVATPFISILGRTYRWRVEGFGHFESIVAGGRQPIFAFWHGRILPATLFWRDRGIVVMTSRNFDGEWIARIIRRFGYGTARGSTSRGGARALVQLRRELEAGHPAGFAVDGPRGPARVAQPGAVFLAGATGHPILPFHIDADRCWIAGRWDQTQVPKPFSRVGIAIGAPIVVEGTSDSLIDAKRLELETVLAALEPRARALATRG